MDSILSSVKKKVGVLPEYKHFDDEIITDINSAFFILNQMGVGPEEPFKIEDDSAVWTDFLEDGRIEIVKSYIPLQVKLLFAPPEHSYLIDLLKQQIKEYEWRMNVDAEKELLYPADMIGIFIEE